MNKQVELLWANIDKILLVILFIVLVCVHVHMVGAVGNTVDPSESAQLNWLEGIIGQVLAALLTLFVTDRTKKHDEPAQPAQPAKEN